ncbi:MAG: hypothetical protein ACD_39C01726G0006, partial [uncultured bacterium]
MILKCKPSYLLLSVLFATTLTLSVLAQEGQSAENKREKAMREAVSLLEKVELESPRAHADLVKLREKLQFLYYIPQFADSEGVPAPMFARRNSRTRNTDWTGFYNSVKDLKNDELRKRLQEQISRQRASDYTAARRFVMLQIDNYDGYVECVYTGKVIAAREM